MASDSIPAANSPPISPALDFFAGTIAGVASLLTGHPFDTIKVRLQTQPTRTVFVPSFPTVTANGTAVLSETAVQKRYNSAWHACTRIVREEGARGLYKGVTSPMLGIALMNASVFTSYKYTMSRILLSSPDQEPTLGQITIAGSVSGIFTSFITTPIERLKILQQSHSVESTRQPSLISLLRTHSLKSLYRGFTATLLRDTGYGPYFLTYEYISRGGSFGLFDSSPHRHKIHGDLREEVDSELWGEKDGTAPTSTTRILVAGGLAGIVGWGITFPLDVIKTKIQSTPLPSPSSPHPYATVRSSFVSAYREGGWRVFVAGLGPTLVRSVPVNMVTFAVFELVVSTFR
ncbi:uncharacterized protein JCM6883_005656 [Sporobolomyces salmoneus]|uniref:uncharacterized protein n=1 Tax=Sporobolomyces salmoneus TaxID=183962 RepID=UPI0031744A12